MLGALNHTQDKCATSPCAESKKSGRHRSRSQTVVGGGAVGRCRSEGPLPQCRWRPCRCSEPASRGRPDPRLAAAALQQDLAAVGTDIFCLLLQGGGQLCAGRGCPRSVTVCPCVCMLRGEWASQARPDNTSRAERPWALLGQPCLAPTLGTAQLCWDSASPASAGRREGHEGVEELVACPSGGAGCSCPRWRCGSFTQGTVGGPAGTPHPALRPPGEASKFHGDPGPPLPRGGRR